MDPLCVSLLVTFCAFSPQWDVEKIRQPAKYESHSGAYVLEVAPSARDGSGPMLCRMLHGKDAVWSVEFPWTFEEAGVADDGTVVGYENDRKQLRILVLDPQGKVRKEHEIEHTAQIIDGPSLPEAIGKVLVHDRADTALIRVWPADHREQNPWWSIRLSTGEKGSDVVPSNPLKVAEHQGLYLWDARAIGDTGLTLCQWHYADYSRTQLAWIREGGVFSLVDLKGATVWSLALLDDYTDTTSEKADDELGRLVSSNPVVLADGPGRRFALWHVQAQQRVEYSVEPATDVAAGWRVVEGAKTAFTPGRKAQAPGEAVELKKLGSIALGAPKSSKRGPIHDVRTLGFTDDGRVEFIRCEGPDVITFVRLTANGDVEFEKDLSAVKPPGPALTEFFDLTGDRWLVSLGEQDPPWLEVDVKSGETKPAPLPAASLGATVAVLPDGSYVALIGILDHSAAGQELMRIRSDGSIAWADVRIGLGPDDSPLEKAINLGGEVASIGPDKFALLSMDSLAVVDLDENLLAIKELSAVMEAEPSYPTYLLPDRKGGLLFHDEDRFWRVDGDLRGAGSVVPRITDGSEPSLLTYMLRVAPDGTMWTSDGTRIFRLGAQGVADLTLGELPGRTELTRCGQALIDGLGRSIVRDWLTQSVHVFDPKGEPMFVCTFEPGELDGEFPWNSLDVARDGTLTVAVKSGGIRFDLQGRRTGTVSESDPPIPLTPDEVAWKSITARPDGKWFESDIGRALLPDGRRVVLEAERGAKGGRFLHFYTLKGEPMGSLELPCEDRCGQLSVSERWIVVSRARASWLLVRVSDQKIFRFDAPSAESDSLISGQTPDGKTLLVLDTERLQLTRFELP